MGYTELLLRRLDKDKDGPTWSAAEIIFAEAERMAEIVRKIGKITKYETKSYVGRARILDLDKAAGLAPSSHPPPSSNSSTAPKSSPTIEPPKSSPKIAGAGSGASAGVGVDSAAPSQRGSKREGGVARRRE
jgi:hypothetical protein